MENISDTLNRNSRIKIYLKISFMTFFRLLITSIKAYLEPFRIYFLKINL